MKAFNPDAPPAQAEGEPGKPAPKKPAVAQTPAKAPASLKGCSISSFEARAFQTVLGCATVHVHNETDAPVLIRPADVACLTTSGERKLGRNFASLAEPPSIMRRSVVPARGDLDVIVLFSNDPVDIAAVQWAR
jgi:hypothetical protein